MKVLNRLFHLHVTETTLRVVFCVFVGLSFGMIFFHESWRDEIQALLISRESQSFSDLWMNTRVEGHPFLWFILLKPIAHLGNGILASQVLHALIAIGTAYIIIFRSPFPVIWKILIPFGYYFLCEYNLIVRNYAIGIFFFFLAHLFYERKNWIGLIISLLLCFQSNANILVLGCAWWAFIFILEFKSSKIKLGIYSLILASGALMTYFSTAPPANQISTSNFQVSLDRFLAVLPSFSQACLVMPKLQIVCWNTTDFGLIERKIISAILLVFIAVYSFGYRRLWLYFLLGTVASILFYFYRNSFDSRHLGHYYIFFVSLLWMSRFESKDKIPMIRPYLDLIHTALITLMLWGSLVFIYYDSRYPFSTAKKVSQYLFENNLNKRFIICTYDYIGSTISGFIDEPIYMMPSRKLKRFIIWNENRSYPSDDSTTIAFTKSIKLFKTLIIVPIPMDTSRYPISLKSSFEENMVGDERAYIYELK